LGPPAVAGVAAVVGPTEGNTSVTISGTNFAAAEAGKLGFTEAKGLGSAS
jgi:hypothetical protein